MLLKSTTRHVRIFTAVVKNSELIFDPRKLTIDIDPDNEFLWNEESLKKINYFTYLALLMQKYLKRK